MTTILSKGNSIFSQFLAELRDAKIQQDRARFRNNMERCGEIFAYEISKQLPFKQQEIVTSLGTVQSAVLAQQPVLATILRAGLPLHQGLLNSFEQADCAYIAAYRKAKKNGTFVIEMNYVSVPDLEKKTVILSDPMLATGQSMVLCAKELMSRGAAPDLHIVAVIASTEGLAFVKRNLPKAHIWVGAVDEELTTQAFIVPGLGDAGDLAFGVKA